MAIDWTDKEELWSHILWGATESKSDQDGAAADITSARYWQMGFDWKKVTAELIDCCEHLLKAIQRLSLYNNAYEPRFAQLYWLDNHIFDEVTWKAIVEAWIKNDFEGRVPTIATIDRMRQILWDEPFSVRWAARPEEQEL